MPSPLPEHLRAIVLRLVRLGKTDQEVAELVECDAATVARYRRSVGVYYRKRKQPERTSSKYE